MICSCGIILCQPGRGWLLCHPTNGRGWDLPKGLKEEGEASLTTALRELHEETGLSLALADLVNFRDLGEHPYKKTKNLHLFYGEIAFIDTKRLTCSSLVIDQGHEFPEIDAYRVFPLDRVFQRLFKGIGKWIQTHL